MSVPISWAPSQLLVVHRTSLGFKVGSHSERLVPVLITEVHNLSDIHVDNHLGTLVARKQGGVDG